MPVSIFYMPATVWKGFVSFGLVSFPVRLYAAARPEAVHFHLLHKKDLSRVREVLYCTREDVPVERADLVKGYEYSKDRYVTIEPEELEKIAPRSGSVMEIVQFSRRDEIDPLYFETSYYVAPEESLSRPYALFAEAMQQTGYDALAKLSMHGREHIVILRPAEGGIVLHTMYFADELHREKQMRSPKPAKLDRKEVSLATKLIETLAAPFKPEKFRDEYRANVTKLIEAKRKGRNVTPIRVPKVEPVSDLMQALQESLASNKTKSSPAKSRPKKAAGAA